MESFFDKLNAAETNEDKNTAYEFEAVYSELDLIKDSVEAKPIRSSSGNEYIFIPKNCLQTFENIISASFYGLICTLFIFFHKNY